MQVAASAETSYNGLPDLRIIDPTSTIPATVLPTEFDKAGYDTACADLAEAIGSTQDLCCQII